MSQSKRIVVNIPEGLLEQVDGIVQRQQRNRSEIVREAMQLYVLEQRKQSIRNAMQQGYIDMARINLHIASEAFHSEQEAETTVERLVSGV